MVGIMIDEVKYRGIRLMQLESLYEEFLRSVKEAWTNIKGELLTSEKVILYDIKDRIT